LASWCHEKTFLRVQLDFVTVEVFEDFSHVVDERGGVSGLDDDVIDINLDILSNLLFEVCLHTPLIGCARVF
jgi:hypothetical protein